MWEPPASQQNLTMLVQQRLAEPPPSCDLRRREHRAWQGVIGAKELATLRTQPIHTHPRPGFSYAALVLGLFNEARAPDEVVQLSFTGTGTISWDVSRA